MKPVGNYELGLRINGRLKFHTQKEREKFELSTMPLPVGHEYEEHDKLIELRF